MSVDNKIYIRMICGYNTKKIKFLQGNVVSLEHTITEYAYGITR